MINLGLVVLGCPARRWYFFCLLDDASFFFLGRTPLDSVSFITYNNSQALRHNPQPICGVAYTPSGQRGMNTVTSFVLTGVPQRRNCTLPRSTSRRLTGSRPPQFYRNWKGQCTRLWTRKIHSGQLLRDWQDRDPFVLEDGDSLLPWHNELRAQESQRHGVEANATSDSVSASISKPYMDGRLCTLCTLLRAWGTKQQPEPFAVASCSFIRVSGDSFTHPADNLCPAERTLCALSLKVRSQVCGNPAHYAARFGCRNMPRIARADGVMESRLMDGEESRHACREPTIALGRLLDRARQTVGRCVRALHNFHERQDNEGHSEFPCHIRAPPIV